MTAELPPIVCCVDQQYIQPLMVMMESLAAVPQNAGLALMILHQGLPTDDRSRVSRHAERLTLNLTFHQAPSTPTGPVTGWVSETVYLRLAIGDLFAHHGTVLYLDADTLVLGDLHPLLLTSLEGRALGAVRDPQNPRVGMGMALPGWADLGLAAGCDYFNSGVMLLDLAECEHQNVFTSAQRFLVEHPDHVTFWDQDALNVAMSGRWLRLDRRWNTFALSPLVAAGGYRHDDAEPYSPLAMLLADEPGASILHFAGPAKPWQDKYPPGRLRGLYRHFQHLVERASDAR